LKLILCDGDSGSNPVSGDMEEIVLKRLRSVLDDDDAASGTCRSGQWTAFIQQSFHCPGFNSLWRQAIGFTCVKGPGAWH